MQETHSQEPTRVMVVLQTCLARGRSSFNAPAAYIFVLTLLFLLPLMYGGSEYRDGDWAAFQRSTTAREISLCSLCVCGATILHTFTVCIAGSVYYAYVAVLLIDVILDYISRTGINSHLHLRLLSQMLMVLYNSAFLQAVTDESYRPVSYTLEWVQLFAEFSMLTWLVYSLDERKVFTTKSVIGFNTMFFLFLMILNYGGGAISPAVVQGVYISFGALFCLLFGAVTSRWLWLFMLDYKGSRAPGHTKPIPLNDKFILLILSCVGGFATCYLAISATSTSTIDFFTKLLILRVCLNACVCILPGRLARQRAIELSYDNKVKANVVRYLSHEFRTPLSALSMGMEELLLQSKQGVTADQVVSAVTDLDCYVSETNAILDNLLLYERLEGHKVQPKFETVDSVSFLCASLQPVELLIQTSRTQFHLLESDESDFSRVSLNVDRQLMAGVLRNIVTRGLALKNDLICVDLFGVYEKRVTNARFSRSRISPDGADYSHLRIAFSFSTCFSDLERRSLAGDLLDFEREAGTSGGGSELHGYILRHLLSLHGGHVRVAPDSSAGSTLYLDLPIAERSSSAAYEAADVLVSECRARLNKSARGVAQPLGAVAEIVGDEASEPVVSPSRLSSPYSSAVPPSTPIPSSGASRLRVLIVDDSDMIRKMEMKLVSKLGHECIEANDGTVALSIVRNALETGEVIDLILLDNEMSIMSGRDAVKAMRGLGYLGVVLGVTGNAMDDDVKDFVACGANEVILKPLTAAKMKDAYERCGSAQHV